MLVRVPLLKHSAPTTATLIVETLSKIAGTNLEKVVAPAPTAGAHERWLGGFGYRGTVVVMLLEVTPRPEPNVIATLHAPISVGGILVTREAALVKLLPHVVGLKRQTNSRELGVVVSSAGRAEEVRLSCGRGMMEAYELEE